MREGPIEAGSIRELIVTIYWLGQKSAELVRNLAMIHSNIGSDRVEELAKEYMCAFAPYMMETPPEKLEEMESVLKKWVDSGTIGIPRGALPDNVLREGPKTIHKFARMRERGSRIAGRRTSLSRRNRSPSS